MSVVIPAFQSEAYVNQAIESVLAQTYQPLELIVVDDGSTDSTARVVQAHGDALRYVWQPNSGAAAARNRGVSESRGPLIAFLDADDFWLPTKLERQVARFREDPTVGIVTCGAESFSGEATTRIDLGKKRARLFWDRNPAWSLLVRSGMSTPTVLMPKTVFDEVGGFDADLRIGEDDNLWIRVAARYPITMVDEILVRVRRAHVSLTSQARLLFSDVRKSIDRLEADPIVAARVGNGFRLKRGGIAWAEGYWTFDRGRYKEARRSFLEAIRYRPLFLNAWALLLISILPSQVIPTLRRLKRYLSRRGRP